jgi:diguanylate cyclase (GGDEF)-like protein
LIDLAIRISGAPRPSQRWRQDLGIGVTVALGTTSVALIAVTLLWVYPQAAWLLLVPTAILVPAYRAYARERPRQDNLAFLYEMSKTLQGTGQLEHRLSRLLSQARDAFQAELAEVLLLPNVPGGVATRISVAAGYHARVVEVPDAEAALECWGNAPGDRHATLLNQPIADQVLRSRLADNGIRNAMVARLYGESTMIGAVIVANRRGSAVFHAQELRVLETIASHASAALENARLVERLKQQALRDPLTDLPNRSVLRDRLAEALSRMQGGGQAVAVLFIDLDGFKAVNDRLGHRAGDQLLVAVAQRFRMAVRSSDLVFRFAGDEFVVLCERVEDQELPIRIADRVQATLTMPFRLDEGEVRVGASIGYRHGAGWRGVRGPRAKGRPRDVRGQEAPQG